MPTELLNILAQAADAAGAAPAAADAVTPLPMLLALFIIGAAIVVGIAAMIRTVHLALGFATTAATATAGCR